VSGDQLSWDEELEVSREESWAEDAVAIRRHEEKAAPLPPQPAPRRHQRNRRALPKAPGILIAVGLAVVMVAMLTGGGEEQPAPRLRLEVGERERIARPPIAEKRTIRRRAGSLAIGLARPAPKAPRKVPVSPPVPEPAPVSEPVAEPDYEPAPEPTPAPEPSPPPAETPPAVEFGM
jgi:hypothetical protein